MELTTANRQDIPVIMEMIRQAKEFLRKNGVDQWQNGYPAETDIERDISRKTGYLCVDGDNILAYLCIDFDGEPVYEKLNGRWLSVQPYAVVHRLAASGMSRGKGVASQIFQLTEILCREKGIHSIKVDTNSENKIMKHLLAKNGYQYCGTVYYEGGERIAWEKLI